VTRSRTLLQSLSQKALQKKHDRESVVTHFTKYVHDAKEHESVTKKLLKNVDKILDAVDSRRDPRKGKNLDEAERKRAEAEAEAKRKRLEELRNKEPDALSMESIREKLLKKIEYYNTDESVQADLRKRVANIRSSRSAGTKHIIQNRMTAGKYPELQQKHHQEYFQHETELREHADIFILVLAHFEICNCF